MQEFVRLVKKRSAPVRIVPIIVDDDDRLEADALFDHIARLKHIIPNDPSASPSWMIVREAASDPNVLESKPAIFFKRGEMISSAVQRCLASPRAISTYQHIDLMLMLLRPNPDRRDERVSAIRRHWVDGFASIFAQPLVWPKWSDRSPDHRKFFLAAYGRLSLPECRKHPMPSLPRQTLDHLRQQEFTGTAAAEQYFKNGFSAYLRMDPDGRAPLLVEHFECARSRRPHPALAPSAQEAAQSEPPGL